MEADDTSFDCQTCQCSQVTETEEEDAKDTLTLKSESFHIKETVSEPKSLARRVKHFRPLVCSRFRVPYSCTKTLRANIFTSNVLVIASGFEKSAAVTFDSDTKYPESLTNTGFKRQIDGLDSESFDTEDSKFMRTSFEEKNTVTVKVSYYYLCSDVLSADSSKRK